MGLDDVLAQAPVHWTDPRVRSLHEAVVIQLPFPDDIKRVAAAAGIAAGDLPWASTGRQIWFAAFNVAAQHLRLPELVTCATAESPALAARVDELRRVTPPLPAKSAHPPTSNEFHGFSDGAKRERQIVAGLPTLLDVRFLALGTERAKSVCRVEATFDGAVSTGTGFRIGETRILTNHHVVFDEEDGDRPASAVQVHFRHELGLDGQPLAPLSVLGHAGERLRGERDRDWAIIDFTAQLPGDAPALEIGGPRQAVAVDDRVAIIQHPNGLPKKIALAHNLVRFVDADVVQYWTDTDEGSSGAPVFNERWEVVALHHAAVEIGQQDQYGYRNQGQAIARIAERIDIVAG